MFYHMNLVKKELYTYQGVEYELVVYREEGNRSLHGYISAGGFGKQIAEISRDVSDDMSTTGFKDPIDFLINSMKEELSSGKFSVPK